MAKDKNELVLQVVVNGTPATITANKNAPLRTIVEKGLAETHNTGQPPQNWEIKDKEGNVLVADRKIEEFHFGPETILFLTLKAGIAGE